MKARVLHWLMLFFICSSLCSTVWADEGEKLPEIMLFFENACPSCNIGEELLSAIYALPDVDELRGQFHIVQYNTFYKSHRDYYHKVLDSISNEYKIYPSRCVVAGNRAISFIDWEEQLADAIRDEINSPGEYPNYVYPGTNAGIDSNIAGTVEPNDQNGGTVQYSETVLNDALKPINNSRDTLYYFYLPLCADCERVKNDIEAFGNTYPDCKIVSLDVSEVQNLEKFNNFTLAFNLPEAENNVPIVFFSNGYLNNKQITYDNLLAVRKRINGDFSVISNTPVLLPGNVLVVLLNGLLGGLNPCGISMLLLLLAVLASGGANAWKAGLQYLAGRSVAYILLGAIFYHILALLENSIFSSLLKVINIVLAATSLLLSFLYFMDFLAARAEKYGKIRMQLPVTLRRFNNNLIKKIANKNVNRFGFILFFLLGAVVAAGEFLCTGQVYLATILYVMKQNSANIYAIIYFTIYLFASLLIPLVIIIAVKLGFPVIELSETARRRLPLIKLGYAAFFLIIAFTVLRIIFFQ